MHEPGPGTDGDHEGEGIFNVDAQQGEEGHEEMSKDDDQTDVPPAPLFTDDVPEGFFRHIAVPDNEILSKGDVGVKDGEGEQERADKVVLVLVEDIAEDALAVEDHRDDVGGGEHQPNAASKIVN